MRTVNTVIRRPIRSLYLSCPVAKQIKYVVCWELPNKRANTKEHFIDKLAGRPKNVDLAVPRAVFSNA